MLFAYRIHGTRTSCINIAGNYKDFPHPRILLSLSLSLAAVPPLLANRPAVTILALCRQHIKSDSNYHLPRLYRQRSLRGRLPFRPPRRYTCPASKVALCLLLEGGAGPFSVPAAVTELHIFFLHQPNLKLVPLIRINKRLNVSKSRILLLLFYGPRSFSPGELDEE